MDQSIIEHHKEQLLSSIPYVSNYISMFHTINKRWAGAISSGKIENGSMKAEASNLFGPLIEDMLSTKTKYGEIQQRLVDAILFEMVKKTVFELTDSAKFTINILKRNLFERTADVGYLATDAEIVDLLKLARNTQDAERVGEQAELVRRRLADYQYEYTVYNEIVILDMEGKVLANLDPNNPIAFSADLLLARTQAIDLHDDAYTDKYLETFRPTDLMPGRGNILIYSQKIEDPETHTALGTLCLCFDFEDEMESIFKDLNQGNDQIILSVLDDGGNVLCSSNPAILPLNTNVPVELDADFRFLPFNGKSYLVSTIKTDGYQGFFGLTWYGMAMIETQTAFKHEQNGNTLDKDIIQKLRNFSKELAHIKNKSEDLLDDMKIDSVNGQINAQKFDAKVFVEVLHFVKWVGEEVNALFSEAIENLQQTIVASLFNEVQFRAFQGNNIADRNLYERANDVCWWALTPMFRSLLTKHHDETLTDKDRQALTDNLQYINNLYTPYLRLVLADKNGVVVATSMPPEGLQEHFVRDGLPKGQEFVGTQLNMDLVHKSLSLASSKDYCVSDFEPTPLYGGRPTYIYSTAVRDPQRDSRCVGVIQIVFDSQPQFRAMLMDTLPKDENKEIVAGSFGVLSDRAKTIVSSTSPEYPVAMKLPLDDAFFQYENGERHSTIVEMESHTYAMGLQVSNGYREYKRGDGYINDIICMIFVPI